MLNWSFHLWKACCLLSVTLETSDKYQYQSENLWLESSSRCFTISGCNLRHQVSQIKFCQMLTDLSFLAAYLHAQIYSSLLHAGTVFSVPTTKARKDGSFTEIIIRPWSQVRDAVDSESARWWLKLYPLFFHK